MRPKTVFGQHYQPQPRFGASPAVNKQQAADPRNDPNSLVIGKALFNTQHYAYFLYKHTPLNCTTMPDIIYSTKDEGEILIEWNSAIKELTMRIFVDIANLDSKMQRYATHLVSKLEKINHPSIMNLLQPAILVDEIQTLVFLTESPDHISTWK